ncbi:MAG: ATP-dependent Clp protease ATP-binding subunit [Patescibacteria group bacterium]
MKAPISEKFTTHLKRALHHAASFAQETEYASVDPAHMIVGLIEQRGSLAAELLGKAGVDLGRLKKEIEEKGKLQGTITLPIPPTKTKQVKLSETAKRALEKAAITAKKYHHRYIGTEHLLAGILQLEDAWLKEQFKKYNVNLKELSNQLEQILKSTSHFPDITNMFEDPQTGAPTKTKQKNPALDFFATDLTKPEFQKDIDPVIGRSDEIQRLIHILLRRTKNNPVLIGEPGVGKTAIVEGLAKKIVEGDVPDVLARKRILRLDLSLVIAGTMYRGEFENRMKQLIEEVRADDNIILFIDEMHTIVGAGSASGSMDAANILKPALARGELRIIGATTLDEYRKHIETDQALERRFQPIIVEEPSPEETKKILEGLKTYYEKFHGVTITQEAIETAVQLSVRFMQEKNLPDKAIDLIDEAASKLKIDSQEKGIVKELRRLEHELVELTIKKEKAVEREEFEQALQSKEEEEKAKKSLREFESKNMSKMAKNVRVTHKDIAAVVSRITKVPLHELIMKERERLLHLEEELQQRIVGQDEAMHIISDSIRRSRVGLSKTNRPIGSFIFLGPSGVGKTETAKVLAQKVFEDESALIRVDMSEFAESFNVSKLIGAPAGYVGYNEGNKLTEPVRRKPYAVVLFDEIEKAHPEVFNLLLQVLDEGYLTDATGKKVNFKNTIIILTSNVGLTTLNRAARMGFDADTSNEKEQAEEKFKELKDKVLSELKDNFRPEFLNRIDNIVVFHPLDLVAVERVAALQLEDLQSRLQEQKLKVIFSPAVIKTIAKLAYSPDQGARAIQKIIQDKIENPLAKRMLEFGSSKKPSVVKLATTKGDITLAVK